MVEIIEAKRRPHGRTPGVCIEVKAARGEGIGPAGVHEMPKPKKKAATKKQPAKKVGAKQTSGHRPRGA